MSLRAACRILAVLLAFSAGLPTAATALPLAYYKVLDTQGVVLTRSANGARWHAVVKDARLPEGQLIQVTSGASVTLEGKTHQKVGGMQGERIQLTLSRPVVARLSSDLLREVSLNALFIDGKNANSKMVAKTQMPETPLTWKDAWVRLAAMVTRIPPPEKPAPDLEELEKQGISLAVSAKRLRIVSPTMNTVVQSRSWPSELKIVWLKPQRGPKQYAVYVWRAGSARGAASAVTGGDHYTVRLKEPGTHFVQIMSPDGAWQSPAHAIYAVEPIATNIAKIPKSSGALEDAVAPMTLDYPPPNFVSSERKVTFSWIADEENTGQEAVLRVKNSLGKIVHIVTTSLTHVELSLTPGRYVWSVRHGGTKGDSMERSLEIVKARFASDRSARRDVIRRLVTSGEDAVVLLEDAR